MKKLMLTVLFMGVCIPSMAKNEDKIRHQHNDDRFVRIDKNKNKEISIDEMLNFHQHRFSNIDMNSDGTLTRGEIKAYKQSQHFIRVDKNKDGVISRQEFTLTFKHQHKRHDGGRMAGGKRFKKMDVNHDHKISKEEMTSFYTRFFS